MTQQQQPRIGIVIGSTREGRFGEKPAHWIHEIAKQRTDLAFELIDLRDHPLPYFNEPRSPAYGQVNNEAARLWAGKLATLDGADSPQFTTHLNKEKYFVARISH
jgi:NAD(P)H-dependent FMN reductase